MSKFKVGQIIGTPIGAGTFKIIDIDNINEILCLTNDFGYSCQITFKDFDNNFYFLEDLKLETNDEVLSKKEECKHDYTEYYGLKECFEYCTKCNIKK